MSEPSLNPDDLYVESFETTAPGAESPPAGMKTYEPGCTTPELCPIGYAAPMKTYEPGCTTPDLCPIG
ncbi:MAG TPA: hypothetical protein VF746_15055 [Longimicrobium sp.]|jgi:hypothetical protein